MLRNILLLIFALTQQCPDESECLHYIAGANCDTAGESSIPYHKEKILPVDVTIWIYFDFIQLWLAYSELYNLQNSIQFDSIHTSMI